jgi:nicotinamidase-related amidase
MSNLFLGIDYQRDFMDGGKLGVPGALADVSRAARFISRNKKISAIAVSLDTHTARQIFHPCWWADADGNNPPPFTVIKDFNKYRPLFYENETAEYIKILEKNGSAPLTIWPYHCLKGTEGAALAEEFADAVYGHSLRQNSDPIFIIKGEDPLSEMYGIIKPENDSSENVEALNILSKFDKIIIAGEAASHCVLSSVRQILQHLDGKNIFLLTDCVSSIAGFEEATKSAYEELKDKRGLNLVNSEDFSLQD